MYLSVAVLYDFRYEKIPNALILIGLVFGFFYRIVVCGDLRAGSILFGIIFPLILFFPFFVIKAFGAGDIKLLMMTGVYFGTEFNLRCIVLALLVAAMVGLVRLVVHKRILSRVDSLFGYLVILARLRGGKTGKSVSYLTGERKEEVAKIHFSLYVLIGATVTECLRLMGR